MIKSNPKGKILEKFDIIKSFNVATKLYFTRWLRVVIILFNTGLSRSAFSTYSLGKLVLVAFLSFSCLCFLSFLLVLCFEFNSTICIIIIYVSATCSMVFSHFSICKNIKKLIITYSKNYASR